MRLATLLVGSLLTAYLAPAAALNPTDNDAGTGADAGDAFELATPVALDITYAGRLTGGWDEADFYAFDAAAGDILTVRLDAPPGPFPLIGYVHAPDGTETFLAFPFGESESIITQTGTWALRVSDMSIEPRIGEDTGAVASYSFSISRVPSAIVHVESTHSEWHALEARWDEPRRVRAQTWIADPTWLQDPIATTMLIEYRYELDGIAREGYWVSFGSDSSFGRHVVLAPSPVPTLEIPVHVAFDPLFGFSYILVDLPAGSTGFLRLWSLSTSPEPHDAFALVSDAPIHVATLEGDGAVSWEDSRSGAENAIMTPIYSSIGEREMTIDINAHFVGVFNGRGAEASVTPPDGATVTTSGRQVVFLAPPHGEWALRIGPTEGVLFDADRERFYGGWVPALGVLPEGWAAARGAIVF